jgi:hypothetical protein
MSRSVGLCRGSCDGTEPNPGEGERGPSRSPRLGNMLPKLRKSNSHLVNLTLQSGYPLHGAHCYLSPRASPNSVSVDRLRPRQGKGTPINFEFAGKMSGGSDHGSMVLTCIPKTPTGRLQNYLIRTRV